TLLPAKANGTCSLSVAVDRDPISLAGNRHKTHATLAVYSAVNVIVVNHLRKQADAVAHVNAQHRIEAAPARVDVYRCRARRRPAKPDGVPTWDPGVIRFAAFFCGVVIEA